VDTNLFGEPVDNRDWVEHFLAEHDSATFGERVRRLRQTIALYPDGSLAMPSQSHAVFSEARSAYVNGDFAAVVLVSQAFIEHRLQHCVESHGVPKVANGGFAKLIKYIRVHGLLDEKILDGLDHLRRIRNPLTHLRPFDNPYSLMRRSLDLRVHPEELLEQEAYKAFALMLTLAVARLPGTNRGDR
jgi:hypothetical protein